MAMITNPGLKSPAQGRGQRLKFVFYRPHSNIWFRSTAGMILKRKPLPNKYAPFLDYMMRADVDVFFTSSLIHETHLKGFLKRFSDGVQLVLWCVLNKISLRQVGLIFTTKSLSNKDVLFLMHYGNFTFETETFAAKGMALAQHLAELKIQKVVHLTHYAYCPLSGASNLAKLRPDLLVAENNLAVNSSYYKKYFTSVPGQFLSLPYTPALRFQNRKSFDQRINKLVVTGSITYKMKSPEFIDFFDVDELQPMRRQLYEQAGNYEGQMDCLISDLDASRQTKPKHAQNRFAAMARRFFAKHAQEDYYKKDIADIYNSYVMFAVPEEICDLPAIGVVEGMACGAAYLGLVNPMYQDIGMVPGEHYIGYDGTVADLMVKVNFYQKRPDEVKRIADAGCRFARTYLSPETIYAAFIARLQSMTVQPEGSC